MNGRAQALMVLGTSSDAGKSLLVTALCRILVNAGVRVAPFKAQNMSLNSAATPDGFEIGRAQALQAQAAKLAPSVDMNPLLLKPHAGGGAQAILNGRMVGSVVASDYAARNRERFWPSIVQAYDRLACQYDVIILEGAGSPAEINLRAGDLVNMAMAHEADARCMLVGDIDRGGVFASLFGTLELLDARDRARITAFVINKFRGDRALLEPGIASIQERMRIPCLGVIPHLGVMGLDEEDGVALASRRTNPRWTSNRSDERLRIAVIAVPHMANFTDFDGLSEEASVDLSFVDDMQSITHADVVVLPGTKDTIADLHWLRSRGLAEQLCSLGEDVVILGICGGLQMLGMQIHDPLRIESGGSVPGLALLPLETTFSAEKTTTPIEGRTAVWSDLPSDFTGYEIHVGETAYASGLAPFALIRRSTDHVDRRDGAVSMDGRVFATYVHGVFDDDTFRHAFVAWARKRSKLRPAPSFAPVRALREQRLDALANAVRDSLDLSAVFPEIFTVR